MTLLDRFRIGANFWSRHAGPRTWSRVDDAALAAELAQARAIGLELLRVFAFVPDFVRGRAPAIELLPEPLARLRRFAEAAERAGVALLPSPLVGHMSGENFDLPGGGDLFVDPATIAAAEAVVRGVAAALADRPAVIGYALTNEVPLWAGVHEGKRPAAADVLAWADRMIAAARAAHPGVPIGLGDGVMAGLPNAELAARVDFVAPHVYYGDPDPLRQARGFDYALALAARSGRPLLLEEFGASSVQAGAAEQAALWNEGIFAAFVAGARGALGWCWSDFPAETVGREAPYAHHAFELGFGLTDATGGEKPACATIRAWRALLDDLPAAPPVPAAATATLLRSSWLERDYPFSWTERGLDERSFRTAHVLAGQAGLRAAIRDEADLAGGPALVLVPSTQRLLTPTWLALEAHARAGGTVYWSYFGGDHAFHQGAWCADFERLTGCRHRLRYGCFDLPADTLRLDGLLAALPPLPTGAAQARGSRPELAPASAYLPIEPIAAEVLARDDAGRAMLVEHAIGRGRVLFCAAPIERYAAACHDATARGVCALYRAIAARAGIGDPFGLRALDASDAERVHAAPLTVGDRSLVAVMNRGWEAAQLPPSLRRPARWSCAPMGVAGEAALGPKQAIILDDA